MKVTHTGFCYWQLTFQWLQRKHRLMTAEL